MLGLSFLVYLLLRYGQTSIHQCCFYWKPVPLLSDSLISAQDLAPGNSEK